MGYFFLPFIAWRMKYTKSVPPHTPTGSVICYHYPMFIFGVILADLETMPERPLDRFRNMSRGKTIGWNTFLIFIGLAFGSYTGEGCHYEDDDVCPFWVKITLHDYF